MRNYIREEKFNIYARSFLPPIERTQVLIQLFLTGSSKSLSQLQKQSLCFRFNADLLWVTLRIWSFWSTSFCKSWDKQQNRKHERRGWLPSLRWLSVISHELTQKTISSPIFLWLTATAAKILASAFSHLRGPAQNRPNMRRSCWAAAEKMSDVTAIRQNRKCCKVVYFHRLSFNLISF